VGNARARALTAHRQAMLLSACDGKRSPTPPIGIDVLIPVLPTGICGTDVHIHKWDEWARKTMPLPMAIGHDSSGHIVETGSNVTDFSRGKATWCAAVAAIAWRGAGCRGIFDPSSEAVLEDVTRRTGCDRGDRSVTAPGEGAGALCAAAN
jgi:threonine dehydrogenase-like Zn-dependent dehydrogenase